MKRLHRTVHRWAWPVLAAAVALVLAFAGFGSAAPPLSAWPAALAAVAGIGVR